MAIRFGKPLCQALGGKIDGKIRDADDGKLRRQANRWNDLIMKEIRPRTDKCIWSGKNEYRYYFISGVVEKYKLVGGTVKY